MSKRRRKDCQQRSTSASVAPVRDHGETGLLTPPLGSFSTTQADDGALDDGQRPLVVEQAARRVSRGCNWSHACAVAFP